MKLGITIYLLILPTIIISQIHVDFKIENYCESPIDSFVIGVQNVTDDRFIEYRFSCDTGSVLIPHDKYVFCSVGYYSDGLEYSAETPWPTFPFVIDYDYKKIDIHAYRLKIGYTDIWNGKYYYCKELCRGHMTDYYKNGNKRLEGRFKKGWPKILKYYNKNGNLLKTEKYNWHGTLIKTEKENINKT